jgi:hypothetical protein
VTNPCWPRKPWLRHGGRLQSRTRTGPVRSVSLINDAVEEHYTNSNGTITHGMLATPAVTMTRHLTLMSMPQGTGSLGHGSSGQLTVTLNTFGFTPGSKHGTRVVGPNGHVLAKFDTLTANGVGQADATLNSSYTGSVPSGSRLAILDGLIAVLVWPGRDDPQTDRVAPALRGPLGPVIPRLAWLVLWASFGWYLLLPGNRAPNAVSQIFSGAAGTEPGWVKPVGSGLADFTAGHGLAVSILLYVLCGLIALGIFSVRTTRPALVLAGLLGLLFWVAEGFGGLPTGQATDPNSGPLLILLAACFWPPREWRS